MIEGVVVEQLRNDGTISSIVSTYDMNGTDTPAVFSNMAPENAVYPYVVVTARKYTIPDAVMDGFDVYIHYYERGESAANARTVSERAEFIFDPNTFEDDRYATIRFWRRDASQVAEPAPLEIHYLTLLQARGSRKKWMQQL